MIKNKPSDSDVEVSSYVWNGAPIIYERQELPCKNKYQVVELFCGCGGTSTGFEMEDFETVLGVDILEPAIKTFHYNHKKATAILGDIRKIPTNIILQNCPYGVDVVIAGIPCQGFSLNNRKRHSDDARNFLYFELLRILRILKPKIVVVENVSGIKSTNNGEVVKNITQGIKEACGLTVKHQTLYANDYGVPQKRARVVFIGCQKEDGFDFNLIEKTHGIEKKPFVTVKDAIGDLPQIQANAKSKIYDKLPFTEYQKIMRQNSAVLYNHDAPKHPAETIKKIKDTKPGMPMYPKFKQRIRLSWDIQSPTQVSGGIRPQFQFGHPEQNRGLTIRERCRLQSFPDNFVIMGGICQGRVQTGNAVPPLLAKAIAKAIKRTLNGEKNELHNLV